MLATCTLLFFAIISGASGQIFPLHEGSISLSQGHKGIVLFHNAGKVLPLIQSISEADAVNICHSKGYFHGSLLTDEILLKLDKSITTCSHKLVCKQWNPVTCTYERRSCNDTRFAKVRCVNEIYRMSGGGKDHGELQVKMSGKWGRVCSRYFDQHAAKLACRAVGFEEGVMSKEAYKTTVNQNWLGDLKCPPNAKHIQDCTSVIRTSCYKKIGIRCFNLKVRLTSGSLPQKGTVEVLFNGQWGGICYTNDANVGTVLARMMGYTRGTIYPVAPTLPLLKHSNCNGNESSLAECPSLVWSTTCSPNKIIGITLSKDIRLVSHTRSRGRVEILHNKVWGGICADRWTDENARVTCNSLGFLKGNVLRGQHHRSGKVHLSNIKCTSNDTYLLNCSHDSWGFHGCPSTERAAVECYRHDIRLRGGSNSKEGRVEIKKNGVWGTICDSDWDNEDASVLCRDLGYAQGTAYNGWKFGPGKGPILHQNVDCIGDELSFEQCFLPEWSDSMRCDHSHDAGVACFNEKFRLNYGELENEGQVEVSFGNGWGSVCSDYWDNTNAHVTCRMLGYETGLSYQDSHRRVSTLPVVLNAVNCSGDEKSLFDCPLLPSRQCVHAGARVRCSKVIISDQYLPDQRLSVHYDGNIGTICPNVTWSDKEASVVCRMKGFMDGFAISKPDTTTYPIGLADLSCTGKEMSVDECSYTDGSHSRCKISSNINVHCSNIEVRLDGNSKNATVGLVQVLYNGIWGSVCNKGWNDESAQVTCRSMGYKSGQMVSKYVSHIPVRNTHQFWLDNVDCNGNETNLDRCKHSTWGNAYCNQENCAAAWCSDYIGIRLRDGRSKQEGRVEILHNKIWGSVCDDSWDDNDAAVVCRMLGYSYGKATLESKHGFTRGQIWLDEVGCDGREFSLEDCSHLEWGWHNCNHEEDAGVICSNNPDAIIG